MVYETLNVSEVWQSYDNFMKVKHRLLGMIGMMINTHNFDPVQPPLSHVMHN